MIFRGSDKNDISNGDNQQVEELLQHMGMMTQHVDQGLAMVDLKGTICFINMACAKMHGYKTSNELLGKQLSTFHRKEKIKSDLVPLVDEAKLKGISTREVEHMRADGTTFPAQMKMIAAKDNNGKAGALIVIVTDITERKQLQRMLVTETAKQTKDFKEQIGQLKKQITENQKSEDGLKQQVDELTSANERLKVQITERQQGEESLKQKVDELAADNGQLKKQIAENQKSENGLKHQTDELTAANEWLKVQITERQQSEENLKQKVDELAAADEQLKNKVAEQERSEERLQQQIKELMTANEQLKEEIDNLEATEKKRPLKTTDLEDESEQIDPKLLDVEKLKSIAELAKRLR